MRLTTFACEPRWITLGGVETLVPKLRIRDIAFLEQWAEEIAVHVVDPPDTDWPPTMGSVFMTRLLATQEGCARVIYATRRGHAFTLTEARETVSTWSNEEISTFYLAIFPEPDGNHGKPGRKMDWVAAIRQLIDLHHYTPDQCLDMPLAQFFGMFGKPSLTRHRKTYDIPINTVEDLAKYEAAVAAKKAIS